MTYAEYRSKMLTMAQDCASKASEHQWDFDKIGIFYAINGIIMGILIALVHPLYTLPALWMPIQAIRMQRFGREARESMMKLRQDILDDLTKDDAKMNEYQDDED